MPRSITPEMAEAAEAAKVSTQAKARGKQASKPSAKADQPKRAPLPEGQQRSRGRTILSSPVKAGNAARCLQPFDDTCANPGRWPLAMVKELAAISGVTAKTLTCTTHLRTAIRTIGLDPDAGHKARFETIMLGERPKAQPKRRRTRKSKAASANA